MLYKPWSPGVFHTEQTCYHPVLDFTNFSVLGSFNNWNIIKFSNKSTSGEYFDDIDKIFLDDISDNMASLVQTGRYIANNANDTKKGYFVIK